MPLLSCPKCYRSAFDCSCGFCTPEAAPIKTGETFTLKRVAIAKSGKRQGRQVVKTATVTAERVFFDDERNLWCARFSMPGFSSFATCHPGAGWIEGLRTPAQLDEIENAE